MSLFMPKQNVPKAPSHLPERIFIGTRALDARKPDISGLNRGKQDEPVSAIAVYPREDAFAKAIMGFL